MSNHTSTITGNALLHAAQNQLDSGKLSDKAYKAFAEIITYYKKDECCAEDLIKTMLAVQAAIDCYS